MSTYNIYEENPIELRRKYEPAMFLQKSSWLLLMALITVVPLAAMNQPVSKPGCPSKCGNVTVPYPFGIGLKCSLNSGFSLVCSDPPKLFIVPTLSSQIGYEVLDISSSQVRIKNEVAFNCFSPSGDIVSNNSITQIVFPDYYPYTFSADANKVTVIGCNVIGVIVSDKEDVGGACVTICTHQKDVVGGYCSANGCCQTSIPKGLKALAVGLTVTDDHGNVTGFDPCAFGFLGEEDRFEFKGVSDFEPGFMDRVMDNIPIVLDWEIGNETCTQGSVCQKNTNCTDGGISGYRCNCLSGFEGNPYLGCTDIDECNDENIHQCSKTCKNNIGNYTCSCPPGFSGDGFRNGKGCVPKSSLLAIKLSLGLSLGALFLVIGLSCTYILVQKRRLIKLKEEFFERNGGLLLQQHISSNSQGGIEVAKIFTVKELNTATNNFNEDNILGKGGYGTVYKGILPDNRIVAVKKSKTVDQSQIDQFINEVIILTRINHRNVVKLMGCCLETEVPLLVYEFISNGTLFDHIHHKRGIYWFSWRNCLRVAVEAAEALAYLHSAASTPVIHRDVKSTNILLDDSYAAKISDFGASRLVPLEYSQLSTLVQGTMGYLDPEYFFSSQLTEKSDVYSFGVVLAELLTRQKPFAPDSATVGARNLSTYFVMCMRENRLFEIIDPILVQEASQGQLVTMGELIVKCLSEKGQNRPTMKEVVSELERLMKMVVHSPWENQEGDTKNLSNEDQGDLYPVPLDRTSVKFGHIDIQSTSAVDSSGFYSFQKDMITAISTPR